MKQQTVSFVQKTCDECYEHSSTPITLRIREQHQGLFGEESRGISERLILSFPVRFFASEPPYPAFLLSPFRPELSQVVLFLPSTPPGGGFNTFVYIHFFAARTRNTQIHFFRLTARSIALEEDGVEEREMGVRNG